MYKEKFANRLKSLRKAANKTQDDIAEFLNISYAAISMMESGKRAPSFDVLCSLADYFNVSLDYLVGRSDNLEINK